MRWSWEDAVRVPQRITAWMKRKIHIWKQFFFLKPTSVGDTKCLRCYQERMDSGLGSGFLGIKELGLLEWCLDRIEYVSYWAFQIIPFTFLPGQLFVPIHSSQCSMGSNLWMVTSFILVIRCPAKGSYVGNLSQGWWSWDGTDTYKARPKGKPHITRGPILIRMFC